MRNLIEHTQENHLECDNPNCDFVLPVTAENELMDTYQWINTPCPKCGDNLLTMEDYILDRKFMNRIDWINRWFSWLTIFIPRNRKRMFEVKVHEGININVDPKKFHCLNWWNEFGPRCESQCEECKNDV